MTSARPVIARIPYLNAAPFYTRWQDLPATSVDLPPRALGEEARHGRADGGFMSVVDWLSLEPTFERVGSLGLACRGEVKSVLLFSRRPVQELSGATIHLTGESSTSVELLELLLEARFGLSDLTYVRGEAPAADAWLRIGDAALIERAYTDHDIHVLDLGQAWFAWTGLPFVYAVWTLRASLPADVKHGLAEFLEASLRAGEADLGTLARAHAGRGLGTSEALEAYLAAFRYRLDEEDERGLDRFRALRRERLLKGVPA